jgi:hypothetical protein
LNRVRTGSVIDNHQLKIVKSLAEDAINGGFEMLVAIVDRHHYADLRDRALRIGMR